MQFSFAILVQCYHQIGLLDQFSFAKREQAERLELSEEARREVLVNALVDRDYFSTAHIQDEIYHNRVQASNPGNLLFDKKYLGKKSVPRNPIMMDLLLRADYVGNRFWNQEGETDYG